MGKVESSVDERINRFLLAVDGETMRKTMKPQEDFSVLGFSDDHDFSFRRRVLTSYVRDELINPILRDLMLLHGYKVEMPGENGGRLAPTSNERFENAKGCELVITVAGNRIGCRYADLGDDQLSEVIERFSLDKVLVVDWSSSEASSSKAARQRSFDLKHPEVSHVSPRGLFDLYLSVEEYELFLPKVLKAAATAKDMVGLRVIPQLTAWEMADYRRRVMEEIFSMRFHGMEYQLDGSRTRVRPFGRLSKSDWNSLDKEYYENGLCRAVAGTEDFARCFLTAEYLHDVFSRGGKFDFTSVACGYFKAVEQLAELLMLQTLDEGNEGLWIKAKGWGFSPRKGNAKDIRPYMGRPRPHILFCRDNCECFDTTLVSLANLLHENRSRWRLSDEGRHYVLWAFKQYASDSRNGYLHKDNIDDYAEVERIRYNTMFILYLVLGGYGLSELARTGLDAGSMASEYSRLYRKINGLLPGAWKLKLVFDNLEPMYVARLPRQRITECDEVTGEITTPMSFVILDGPDAGMPPCGEILHPRREVTISRDRVPAEVWSVMGNGCEERL